ncbi:hypothetical protein [Sphingomonas adhaesiva]|uniref:hypothetical protein n=1 Tax=Sphingomonas adhaesiva TaxID=28212 RepID=UPI00114364FC|nr:hypothetical protein [Sphingomonas adhaesiva]
MGKTLPVPPLRAAAGDPPVAVGDRYRTVRPVLDAEGPRRRDGADRRAIATLAAVALLLGRLLARAKVAPPD